MLTKDPVNDTHAHFLEQSATVKNSPSFRRAEPQFVILVTETCAKENSR